MLKLEKDGVVMIYNYDIDGFLYAEGNARLEKLIANGTNKEYWLVEFENEKGNFYRRWIRPDGQYS